MASVTASDARPPSDTGTTGWHRHPSGSVCEADKCHWPERSEWAAPVIVVDPAEARETIARAALESEWDMSWEEASDIEQAIAYQIADAVLAALAGQGQP